MSKTEKELAIDIIAEAFNENKSANYVVKQDSKRVERLKYLVEYSYNVCKKYGEVFINEDQTAVCLVNLPNQVKKNMLFDISQDIKLIFRTIGVSRIPLVLKRESVLKRNHPKLPFCHLWYIAVRNKNQKQGAGTALLQQVVNKYEEKGLPIYLETSMDENVPWYEKNGFEVYGKNQDFGFTTYLIRKS